MANRLYHAIFWRSNPQLTSGGYYTFRESITIDEIKKALNPSYGGMSLIKRFNKDQQDQAISEFEALKKG